jgi:protein-S-isoprenylcysteine O-methyltransferase Ste14
MKRNPVLPPTYLLLALMGMLVLHVLIPIRWIIPAPWNLLGLLPLSFGLAVNLMADRALKLANTTVKPFEESSALVTVGVYGLSRHPMYLGFVVLLAGVAILLRSLTPWLIVPALAVALDRIFVVPEESMLANRFAQEWERYKRRARRWL